MKTLALIHFFKSVLFNKQKFCITINLLRVFIKSILHKLFIDLKEQRGVTFLMVTHNPELVALGDRVLEMKDGKIFDK